MPRADRHEGRDLFRVREAPSQPVSRSGLPDDQDGRLLRVVATSWPTARLDLGRGSAFARRSRRSAMSASGIRRRKGQGGGTGQNGPKADEGRLNRKWRRARDANQFTCSTMRLPAGKKGFKMSFAEIAGSSQRAQS